MIELQRVTLPAIATSVCATPEGNIFIEMRANWDRDSQMQLACFDFMGQQKWQRAFTTLYPHAVKVANESIWLNTGKQIYRLDIDGAVTQVIPVALTESEYIGDFLVTPQGFYICSRGRRVDTKSPRLLRIADNGQVQWATSLLKPTVSFNGVVETGVHTNWQLQPKKPWRPTSWQPDLWQPLLATDNRLLASYVDYSSGIGISYCLDAATGEHLWATPPRPSGNKSLAPNQTFLIGSQGYGVFDTWLYNANGEILQHWQSHGYIVISQQAEMRVVEMQNILPSKMSFAIFELSGEIRKGPHLPRYRTAYPSIDKSGNVTFWREGELLTVDTQMNLKSLYSSPSDKPHLTMFSRTLLLESDKLAFTVSQHGGSHELWIFNTPLDVLATSMWPCGGGNLGNNAVYPQS